jgi:hypothetical protein
MATDKFGNTLLGQVIPPNGFAGAAQQTPAVRHSIATATGQRAASGVSTRRRKRKSTSGSATKAVRRKRKAKAPSVVGSLTKGSAAALAWGKKMHAARKKKAKKA